MPSSSCVALCSRCDCSFQFWTCFLSPRLGGTEMTRKMTSAEDPFRTWWTVPGAISSEAPRARRTSPASKRMVKFAFEYVEQLARAFVPVGLLAGARRHALFDDVRFGTLQQEISVATVSPGVVLGVVARNRSRRLVSHHISIQKRKAALGQAFHISKFRPWIPYFAATNSFSAACFFAFINSTAFWAMCSAETSNSFTSSHGAPESPKRSLTPM